MLTSLEIKNYALIQNFEVVFKNGLHVITGETGAGKSILLGALGLVLGKRADSKVLFNQDEKCMVEATFDISNLDLGELLNDFDFGIDHEIIIRREITPNGKSRAFLNDTPVTLDLLQDISGRLIDIHQQFDTISFQKSKQQLEAVDAMVDDKALLQQYKTTYTAYKRSEKELAELKLTFVNSNKEAEFLLFQLRELEEAKLETGEQEELENAVNKMSNAEDIKSVFSSINISIEENENSITNQLTGLNRSLSHLTKIDASFQNLHDRIESVLEELKDISSEASDISENSEYDKNLLEQNQERLNTFYRLHKKHGVNNNEELIALRDTLKEKSKKYVNIEADIIEKEKEVEQLKADSKKTAQKISQQRQKVAPIIDKEVNKLLALLSMANAQLKIAVQPGEILNENGIDTVNFLFSANKGGELLPIKDVASGGELARLTLCIKSILANKMQMPTMVFDEIDTGVSGEVASKMGDILKTLSSSHQLIVITHSPQIASKGDYHLFVFKQDEANRTISQIKLLNEKDRVVEIAKMLSGENPGKAALDNAKELLSLKK